MSSASSRAASRSSLAASEAARVALVLAARAAADCYAHYVVHVRAISDDDYARVVIAEAFARTPKLDPSGTSWLPAPFWLNGAAMMVFGRSLEVARVVALALGFASSLLLYAGAKLIIRDARRAAIAAAIATLTPWSAFLGVATVPELPVAALSLYALATLARADDHAQARVRCLGALALALASLSRYEGWPLALGFAALTALDAARARGRCRAALLAAAAGALVGPAAWIIWNRHAHGDALHFAARVAAFARASSEGARPEPFGYLLALVADRTGLTLAAGGAILWAILRRADFGDELRRWARPAALVVLALVSLTLAGIGDAAPTHHPERVTLLASLALSIAAVGFLARLVAALKHDRRVATALAFAGLAATSLLAAPALVDRAAEEAMGVAASRMVAPGEVVFVEVVDYGYLALVASMGRPEDAVTDRLIDPREPRAASSFDDDDALRAALERIGPRVVVGRVDSCAPAVLGAPASVSGPWAVWQIRHGGARSTVGIGRVIHGSVPKTTG